MKKVILIIMDGWGIADPGEGNAISLAKTPVFDHLMRSCPNTTLQASGLSVGLPSGQMGNSEVGHLNIGSGRIIYQDYTRISKAIEDGDFFTVDPFIQAIERCKEKKKSLHLMGLVSDGGVHSHNTHLYALLKLCKIHELKDVYVHAFLDGRDVAPTIGSSQLRELQEEMKNIGVGKIATVSGRYYAMDRDKRWDRTELAYDAITLGQGNLAKDPIEAVEASYQRNVTDEFIIPTVILENDQPVTKLEHEDSVIFFNFRPDRARQLTHAFMDVDFDGFQRKKICEQLYYVTMTQYDKTITNVTIAYPPESYTNTLGEVIAQKGLHQLRVAETEKYAHVTFFFNGGVEKPNLNEDRALVPSPKVATYDLLPQMSAEGVRDEVLKGISSDRYALIIVNFANSDMVGHTGVIQAAVEAVETVDHCVGEILECAKASGYQALVTSDHGNSEKMIDEITKGPFTAHTTNMVPFIYVGDENLTLQSGILADISPTILDLMEIEKPNEMTGHSLIEREE